MTSAVARKLESIRSKSAMKNTDIAAIIDARPETVSRWNSGKAYPHAGTEKLLLELEFVVDMLSDFYTPREARLWLFSPQKLLNGETPANLIKVGKMDAVRRLVDQLRDGVYL